MSGPPIRIVVLYGGQSAEHNVSRVSASHVMRALDPDRYEIDPVVITTEGAWLRSTDTLRALAEGPHALPDMLPVEGTSVGVEAATSPTRPDQPVVVLPVLHGPRGEDGTVQGLLELADVAYVGSGVMGSALNMDKAVAKVVAGAVGLPQVDHLAVRDCEIGPELVQRVETQLGWPVFVKPTNMGSSVGVSRAHDADSLATALATAAGFDEWVLIEEAVIAREIEVGVIGNHRPRASVVGEIVPTHDFYDYEDKYLDGAAQMVVPADLPAEVARQAQQMAIDAYRALRCDGLGRVDFFYEETGRDGGPGRGLLLNEVNTMPGFTPYSMFPSLWQASGLSYSALLDELIGLAIERHAHRAPHRRQR